MSLYYFDLLRNGEVSTDDQGQDLPDNDTAHKEAVRALAEIACEEIPKDGPLELQIVVYDDARQPLFRTRIMFEPG
jgi:hypothetical protein